MNPKPPQAHTVPKVRFLCEQKGPSEALLTTKLSQAFASGGLVDRAYLVRVSFGANPAAMNVVLAIRTKSGAEERGLLPVVSGAFASIFGSHEHLDILFVREEQERAIREVCPAFYSAPAEVERLH
jgi:hypothetical protein